MKPVRFSRDADAEVRDEVDYYNRQTPGRGDRFADAVEATAVFIGRFPKAGAPYRNGSRRRKVSGFPHSVFYFEYASYVWVQAVHHGSRQPDTWMTRDLPPDDPD